jgi:hypothetical protein
MEHSVFTNKSQEAKLWWYENYILGGEVALPEIITANSK